MRHRVLFDCGTLSPLPIVKALTTIVYRHLQFLPYACTAHSTVLTKRENFPPIWKPIMFTISPTSYTEFHFYPLRSEG